MDCTPLANISRPAAPPDVIAARADVKSADLARMKAVATALLVASVLIAVLARALEPRHWAFSYVAAWAEAAAVGGLADWYAIVALFRHPLGIPMPHIFRADAYLVRRFVALISQAIDEAKNDQAHPFRRDFDRFAREFVERLASSPELALRAERLKREFLARPEIGDLAEGLWLSFVAFVDEDARGDNSLLLRHMADFLADVGRKRSQEPKLRAEINIGAVKTLQAFIENNKSEIARFITNQIKAWDVDRMIDIIELNIGRDLQYIRLNGTFVGGLAGLVLFAAERAAQLK